MNFAIIGTGGRSLAYREELRRKPDLRVTALCDTDLERLSAYHREWYDADPGILLTQDYREAVALPGVDVVLICTPDTAHVDVALSAAAAGRHMLLEKPVATTRADLLRAYDGLADYDRSIHLGFVLRYTDFYRAIRDRVQSGSLGTVVTLSASESLDPRHAGSFYRRWQRFSRNNGGLLNAKCCHDLDLMNWILDADPVEVFATGGRRIFVPDPELPETCAGCPRYGTCPYAFNYGYYEQNFRGFHSLSDLCVYNSEKDIVDHECVSLRYSNGVSAQFELCMFSPEENRKMTVRGTKATLEADFLRQTIRIRPLVGGREEEQVLGGSGEGHGGGDGGLLADLVASVRTGVHVNHIRAGCLASLTALAADESLVTRRPERPGIPGSPA
jgi:predicted dehydrogenase